jgi:hypothetical protein
MLTARAGDRGIITPTQLENAIGRDNKTLEKMGMTPVDVMLTLKGLEIVRSTEY